MRIFDAAISREFKCSPHHSPQSLGMANAGRFIVFFSFVCFYTLSHRECGHPRHLCHATFADCEMISTTTGSWIRSHRLRLRRDRIQLPVVVEIILKSAIVCITKVTRVSTLSMGQTVVILIVFVFRCELFLDEFCWTDT